MMAATLAILDFFLVILGILAVVSTALLLIAAIKIITDELRGGQ